MNVVALYKTFSGHEFVEASLKSIYPWIRKVVFVHSDVSWTGETGNTVAPVVERVMQDRPEWKDWIINLYGRWTNQDDQYQYGLDWIHNNLEFDLIMLIDTDEVWDEDALKRAFCRIENLPERDCFSTRLYSYVKSIFYRVDPIDLCRPTVFLRPSIKKLNGARGWNQPNRFLLYDVYFHHFTFVRFSELDIRKKFATSIEGDGEGAIGTSCDEWMGIQWLQLPFAFNFHYQAQVKGAWHRIKRVWKNDLPKPVVEDSTLMNNFYSHTPLTPIEEEKIFRYSQNARTAVLLSSQPRRDLAILLSLGADEVLAVDKGFNYLLWPYAQHVFPVTFKDVDNLRNMEIDVFMISHIEDTFLNPLFYELGHHCWHKKIKPGGYIIFDNYPSEFLENQLGVGNLITGIDYPEQGNLLITQRMSEW
jgi:hypothetical protein